MTSADPEYADHIEARPADHRDKPTACPTGPDLHHSLAQPTLTANCTPPAPAG